MRGECLKIVLITIGILIAALEGLSGEIIVPKPAAMMAFSEKPGNNMYAVHEITPLGWSRDGAFAYIETEYVEGRGGVLFAYVVLDAVNDRVLWRYEDDWPDSGDVELRVSMMKIGELLKAQLGRYGIIREEGVALQKFPLREAGMRFAPEIVLEKKVENDPFLGDIRSVSVYIYRDRVKKRIYYRKDPGVLSYWIAGYFKSPFEPRILVAIGEERWGFEGTEGHFVFSGCSLQRGFDTP